MKIRGRIPLLAVLSAGLLLVCLQTTLAGAVAVKGEVTLWESGEKLDGTLIKVYRDSALVSKVICDENGSYSMDLQPGNYHFMAVYIDRDGDKYLDEEDVTLYPDQNTTLDFLMILPELDINFSELEYYIPELDINFSELENETEEGVVEGDGKEPDDAILISIFIILAVSVLILSILKMMGKKGGIELEDDEKKIMEILKKQKGKRMLQSDLLGETDFSRAKVSLVLSELEKKGLIRKEVKGRTNLIELAQGKI